MKMQNVTYQILLKCFTLLVSSTTCSVVIKTFKSAGTAFRFCRLYIHWHDAESDDILHYNIQNLNMVKPNTNPNPQPSPKPKLNPNSTE